MYYIIGNLNQKESIFFQQLSYGTILCQEMCILNPPTESKIYHTTATITH